MWEKSGMEIHDEYVLNRWKVFSLMFLFLFETNWIEISTELKANWELYDI